jgi:peptide-methionine (S)-S-oxide reductase
MKHAREAFLILLALLLSSCTRPSTASASDDGRATSSPTASASEAASQDAPGGQKLEVAVVAGGCFWCVEAVYSELRGVKSVESGYSGGKVDHPSYQQVCSGTTGHAEAVRITFDPSVISYHDLLQIFFTTHDPTTLNRQGADVGTQYRSAIFYQSEEQKRVAEQVKQEMQKEFSSPIVTEITPLTSFYKAEDYHQDYYQNNAEQPYCRIVIAPKLLKFREKYQGRLQTPAAP